MATAARRHSGSRSIRSDDNTSTAFVCVHGQAARRFLFPLRRALGTGGLYLDAGAGGYLNSEVGIAFHTTTRRACGLKAPAMYDFGSTLGFAARYPMTSASLVSSCLAYLPRKVRAEDSFVPALVRIDRPAEKIISRGDAAASSFTGSFPGSLLVPVNHVHCFWDSRSLFFALSFTVIESEP